MALDRCDDWLAELHSRRPHWTISGVGHSIRITGIPLPDGLQVSARTEGVPLPLQNCYAQIFVRIESPKSIGKRCRRLPIHAIFDAGSSNRNDPDVFPSFGSNLHPDPVNASFVLSVVKLRLR
jgi:hypothetical protein